MNREKVFLFKPDAMFYNFDESSFIIDISDHTLYNLGKSSALMAASLDGKIDMIGIIDIIRQYYQVSAEDAVGAVEKFIAMMLQKHLIEEVN